MFLDRLYANTMSTLPVGRARYGLMLREDGIVFDDGTVSRLGPEHFLVTTTTAQRRPCSITWSSTPRRSGPNSTSVLLGHR